MTCRVAVVVLVLRRELLVLHTKAEPKPGSPLMTLSIKPLLLTAAHKAPQCLPSTLAEVCVFVVNSCTALQLRDQVHRWAC
jgi:hypothetical protein